MRYFPLLAVVWLAACTANGSNFPADKPGIEVAQAALKGGSPQAALQMVGTVLQRDPGNSKARLIQGDALTVLGEYDQAALSYSAVLQRDPRSIGAQLGLGRIRLATDPSGAELLFLNVLRDDPRNTAALTDLGVARDLQGHHDAAQTAYRSALGIDPQLTAAQVDLALSMAMTGNAADAVEMLRPLANNPNAAPKLRHDLAAALTMAGKREEAAQILRADLSPTQVREALQAYASARSEK